MKAKKKLVALIVALIVAVASYLGLSPSVSEPVATIAVTAGVDYAWPDDADANGAPTEGSDARGSDLLTN